MRRCWIASEGTERPGQVSSRTHHLLKDLAEALRILRWTHMLKGAATGGAGAHIGAQDGVELCRGELETRAHHLLESLTEASIGGRSATLLWSVSAGPATDRH
mmetsp:Transcript_98616/g.228593  ORF Transcript_98616/g.228593 Transcript_98616/m.228593 type:complete len:103 (+) Transcript_98616:355-663(+)